MGPKISVTDKLPENFSPTLGWMRPSAAPATLSRAAEKLNATDIEEPPIITESVAADFWGAVVITYEAGRVVAIEKRELA